MDSREEFIERGYVVARKMFSKEDMALFIAEIKKARPYRPGPDHLDRGTLRFYSNLFHGSPAIRAYLTRRELLEFVMPVAGPDLWVRWDQAVEKGPHSGVFPWHQDNGYSGLLDEHFQLWIALSEMTRDNGGLWLVPGSQKRLLPHRTVGNHREAKGAELYDAPESGRVFIEADVGDVVLFSSYTLHKTYENSGTAARWAYVAEFLPLRCYDPTALRPYFVAARDGTAAREFTDSVPGSRSFRQRIRYAPLSLRSYCRVTAKRVKSALASKLA
jgi:hypothetical protein